MNLHPRKSTTKSAAANGMVQTVYSSRARAMPRSGVTTEIPGPM